MIYINYELAPEGVNKVIIFLCSYLRKVHINCYGHPVMIRNYSIIFHIMILNADCYCSWSCGVYFPSSRRTPKSEQQVY